MGKTDGKHFAGILDAAGTTEIGLTPSRTREGVPTYSEGKSSALSPQIFTGDTSYGRFNPEEEIAIFQSDYRGGMGLEVQDDTEPRRYFYAIGADARFRDEVRLGPAPTTVTKVTLPTITYAGADPFNTPGGSVNTDATGFVNAFRGKLMTVTITCTFTTGGGGETATFYLNDGNSNIATQVESVTGAKTIKLTGTLHATLADKIRVTITLSGGSGHSVSGIAMTIATWGSVDSQCDFNGSHYLASGAILARVDSAGTMYLSAIMPATITQIFPGTSGGTDYLFVLLGWSNAYYYLTTAETATLSTLTNNTLKFMCVSGATFYGSDTNSTIVSTTNPINGGTNWGTSKQIGEDGYNIVSIVAYGGLVYARKSDCKVFYIDSSGNVQVLIDGQANLAGTNTTLMFVWREEYLFIPFGAQSIFAYDGTTLTDVSTTNYIKGASDYTGQPQAITGDDRYIYVILGNSPTIEVLTLNYESVEGTSDWRWHGSLAHYTMTSCSSAFITSIYKKRMYIGSSVGSEAFIYISICAKYGNISGDSNYVYESDGYLVTSWYHYNLKGDTKAWIKLTLKMSGTTAAIYWQAFYQKYGDSSWTEIASATNFKTSPSTTAYIPVDASSNKPTSNMIRFKFQANTNDSAVSPVLLGFDVRGIWYPTERKTISMQVRVKDGLPTEQGQIDDQLGSTIRSTLDNLNSSTWPRAFYPPYWESSADTIYVKQLLLPGDRQALRMVRNEQDNEYEWVYDLLLLVVPLS